MNKELLKTCSINTSNKVKKNIADRNNIKNKSASSPFKEYSSLDLNDASATTKQEEKRALIKEPLAKLINPKSILSSTG